MSDDVLVEHTDPWMREHGIKRAVILSLRMAGFPPLPNALRRLHWAARADSNRTWRGAAYLTALQAKREHPDPSDFPLRRAVLQVTHIRPDRHWPDPDGVAAAVKPVIDGMVDAGLLVSDRRTCVSYMPVLYEVGPSGLRVDVLYGSAA